MTIITAPASGVLPEIQPGVTRYIASREGLFIEVRTRAMHALVLYAKTPRPLPYGKVTPFVRLRYGQVPRSLYEVVIRKAVAASPSSWVGLIVADHASAGYALWVPTKVSPEHARIGAYSPPFDPQDMVLDLRSHGPRPAAFLASDDAVDRSHQSLAVLSVALGSCSNPGSVKVLTRLAVRGQLVAIRSSPWAVDGSSSGSLSIEITPAKGE